MDSEAYIDNGTMVLYQGSSDSVSPEINLSGDAIVEFDVRFEDGIGVAKVDLIGTSTMSAMINANGLVSLEGTANISEQLTFNAKEWKHIRITKIGDIVKLYVDGVSVLSLTENLGNTSFRFLGQDGYIAYDHIRIYPADALAETNSFDPLHKYIKSVQGPNGLTTKKMYNDRMQPVVSVDAYDRVVSTDAGSFQLKNTYEPTLPYIATSTQILGEETFYDDFSYDEY